MGEHAELLPQDRLHDLEFVCETLDLALEHEEMSIDRIFFERPGDFPLLDLIRRPLEQWLAGCGLTQAQSMTIGSRLRSYFVFALNNEWRLHSKTYEELQEALETPFTSASEREQGWLRYSAWLQKQIDERMFHETFSLQQIYVPLRAWYTVRTHQEEGTEPESRLGHESDAKPVVVDLATMLDTWLEHGDPTDAIRVISGGPGCGKSSFTKMFAARQAQAGAWRVVFIPLHLFAITDDLVDAVGRFVREDRILTHHPLEYQMGDRRVLLIFDGLDELAMQGKVAEQATQHFIREVCRTVERLNLHGTRVYALLSGREVVIQANVHEFRKPGQLLHILPYWVSEDARKTYEDTQGLLQHDQRQLWWQRYGGCTGQPYTAMPEAIIRSELEEITAQPLLNYLLALSFTRGRINFATEANLNAIYNDLLHAVYERGWAGYQHLVLRGIEYRDFVRILEEIGLAAWHGDGRTTTVREIENHCENSGLRNMLTIFQERGRKQGSHVC